MANSSGGAGGAVVVDEFMRMILIALAVSAAFGQDLQFEVASVKRSTGPSVGRQSLGLDQTLEPMGLISTGGRTSSPGRIHYSGAGLKTIIGRAYWAASISFNTDYIYWLPHLDKIDNILIVGAKPGDDVISLFKEFKQTGVVENEYAREKGTGIYLLTGANSIFTEAFYKKTEERKKNLEIF